MRVQISQIRILRIHKILLFIVMGLVIAGCSLMQSGVRIRVVDTPQGVSSLNTGTIVTLAASHPVQTRSWKINSSKADKPDTSSKDLEVVATVFDDKVRLINLYSSNSRGRIELSFTSTAQSLVLLNPIFIGLIAEKKLEILQRIKEHPLITDLAQKVATADTLLNDEISELSCQIAIDIATKEGIVGTENIQSSVELDKGAKFLSNHNLFLGRLINNFKGFLISPSYAQDDSSIYEYSIQDFSNEGRFLNIDWPRWHGMTIEQINGEIRIGGTSVLAQQLIVVPEGKIRLPINKLSDINNDVLNNDQYVAEKLIYPSDISMTNFNLFNTISGQNRLSEPILTNAGEPIPPGKYDLLLSTNIEMPTDSRIFGAFTFNMVMFVSDLLDIVPSMFGLDELSDSPALLERLRIASTEMVPIAQSCLADIEQQESKIEKIDAIYQCLAENSIDVAKVFGKVSGLNIADEAPVLIRDLIYLRGDAWKKISRSFGGMLNFVDSASTVSRIFLLGLYMDDEPWYLGKLSVVDPTQFQSFPIVCSKNPVAMFYDLEFTRCIGTEKLEAKNYSSDWYEVERLFKKEPEEELPIFDSIFGYYRPSTPGLKEGLLSTLIAPGQTVEMSVNVRAQNPLSVRRLRGNPTRTVSVACDDPEREIWGIRITPKCTSSGAYIDLSAKSSQDLLIGLDGGDSFVLEKQPWESENITSDGYITSTSRAVSFQISVLN